MTAGFDLGGGSHQPLRHACIIGARFQAEEGVDRPMEQHWTTDSVRMRGGTNRALAALGLAQAFLGSLLLATPHHFKGLVLDSWKDQHLWAGPLLVLAGVLLIWTRVLPVYRFTVVAGGLGLTAVNFIVVFG